MIKQFSAGAFALTLMGANLTASPADAHHSQAMFDPSKTITTEGTVVELQWTNPHSWLVIYTHAASGADVKWQLEMGPPGKLGRVGLKPNSLKPGDKVAVAFHPMRDGLAGGQLLAVTGPDGLKHDDLR